MGKQLTRKRWLQTVESSPSYAFASFLPLKLQQILAHSNLHLKDIMMRVLSFKSYITRNCYFSKKLISLLVITMAYSPKNISIFVVFSVQTQFFYNKQIERSRLRQQQSSSQSSWELGQELL